jgi:hypothetical protein
MNLLHMDPCFIYKIFFELGYEFTDIFEFEKSDTHRNKNKFLS